MDDYFDKLPEKKPKPQSLKGLAGTHGQLIEKCINSKSSSKVEEDLST